MPTARNFLALALFAAACGDPTIDEETPDARVVVEFPELDLSLREQVQRMEERTLASADLTAGYLDRIGVRDQGPNGLRAILLLDSRASATAAALDEQRGTGAALQGAVIVVKDNIDTAGLATTAGSAAMVRNVPAADATVIARLRAANAVVVGKSNLSEWGNFRGYGATSGWSSRGGQTLHPVLAAYNPCGSSSGSGVAVAAGLVSAAIGTETDGSIVCPSSINGVVGFKPTVGLVSRAGVIPLADSYDTIGPMTKTVADAARVLGAIAGPDPGDPATAAIPPALSLDFETPLASASLAGVRLGVVRSTVFDAGTTQVFEMELQRLAAAGAILVDVQLPDPTALYEDSYTVDLHEFKVGINTYLASHARADQPGTLAELIAYNSANAGVVMPYFGQQIFLDAQATTGLAAPAYLTAKARARQLAYDDGILAAMTAGDVEALIAPTMGPAWRTNYTTGDEIAASSSTFPAVAGCPHLTVPMGTVSNLPVGMSFFARPFDDARVLALGHAYERLRGASRSSAPYVEPVARPRRSRHAHAGR